MIFYSSFDVLRFVWVGPCLLWSLRSFHGTCARPNAEWIVCWRVNSAILNEKFHPKSAWHLNHPHSLFAPDIHSTFGPGPADARHSRSRSWKRRSKDLAEAGQCRWACGGGLGVYGGKDQRCDYFGGIKVVWAGRQVCRKQYQYHMQHEIITR